MVTLICSQCGHVVEASGKASRVCPACKQGVLREPARAQPAREGTPLWVPLLVLALLGAAALGWWRWGSAWRERRKHPSESVAGSWASQTLRARLQFPAGWRHLRQDRSERRRIADGAWFESNRIESYAQVRSASFFRGGKASAPHARLTIVVEAYEDPRYIEAIAHNFFEFVTHNFSQEKLIFMKGARVEPCQPVPPVAMRCGASTADRVHVVQFWPTASGVAWAHLHARPGDEAFGHLDAILASLAPL